MSEENTVEQVERDSAYHNRNLTLRELALNNLIQRLPEEEPGPIEYLNTVWAKIRCGHLSLIIPPFVNPIEADILVLVGQDTGTPVAAFQSSINGGELWDRTDPDNAFTGSFFDVGINGDVVLAVGDFEEIQKYSIFTASLVQKNGGGADRLHCIAYGNGVWIAAGENGKILKSTDGGESWADKSIGGTDSIDDITYFNNRFVAISEYGYYFISIDLGETWTKTAFSTSVGIFEPNGLINDGTKLIAYGEWEDGAPGPADIPAIAISTNGYDWTVEVPNVENYPQAALTYARIEGGAYINGVHILTGDQSFLYSYDGGKTWVLRQYPLGNSVSVAPHPGYHFCFVGRINDDLPFAIYRSGRFY